MAAEAVVLQQNRLFGQPDDQRNQTILIREGATGDNPLPFFVATYCREIQFSKFSELELQTAQGPEVTTIPNA